MFAWMQLLDSLIVRNDDTKIKLSRTIVLMWHTMEIYNGDFDEEKLGQ